MLEFQCHYRQEKWLTPRYFEFVEDFFNTANSSREAEDCEPPPCPTTPKPRVTTARRRTATVAPTLHRSQGGEEISITVPGLGWVGLGDGIPGRFSLPGYFPAFPEGRGQRRVQIPKQNNTRRKRICLFVQATPTLGLAPNAHTVTDTDTRSVYVTIHAP